MENKNKKIKRDLRDILYCFQYSRDYGVFIGENLRDPRKENLDEYWSDTECEALKLCDLLHDIDIDPNNENQSLPESTMKKFNHLSGILKRISKRIDRILLE